MQLYNVAGHDSKPGLFITAGRRVFQLEPQWNDVEFDIKELFETNGQFHGQTKTGLAVQSSCEQCGTNHDVVPGRSGRPA